MQDRTRIMLDSLNEVNWFDHPGQQESDDVVVLSSWQETIKDSSSIKWKNVKLEAQGDLHAFLVISARERSRLWNSLVVEIKQITEPMVERKIQMVMQAHNLPATFKDSVSWDILNIAMEEEYADLRPPGFYANLANWYRKGHFPCGWRGKYPKGMLIIY